MGSIKKQGGTRGKPDDFKVFSNNGYSWCPCGSFGVPLKSWWMAIIGRGMWLYTEQGWSRCKSWFPSDRTPPPGPEPLRRSPLLRRSQGGQSWPPCSFIYQYRGALFGAPLCRHSPEKNANNSVFSFCADMGGSVSFFWLYLVSGGPSNPQKCFRSTKNAFWGRNLRMAKSRRQVRPRSSRLLPLFLLLRSCVSLVIVL